MSQRYPSRSDTRIQGADGATQAQLEFTALTLEEYVDSEMAQWAGNFDCSECGRKRLIADEFSKKMLEKRKKVLWTPDSTPPDCC